MKLINKFLIVILILGIYVIFEPIKADNLSGTGGVGSAGSGTTTGKSGSWNKYANGFYIAAYNNKNEQKGNVQTIVNSTKKGSADDLINNWIDSSNNSTDPTKLYDYLNIPYGSSTGDYAKLKEYISSINLEEGDYIIIEPFTKIGGVWNTFRSIISNNSKDDYETQDGTKEYSFYTWYWRAAVLMANAAKVGTNITVGGHTYTAPSNNCTEQDYKADDVNKFCGWKGNSYIGYGLVIVKYEDMYPKLTVRYNSNGATVRKYENRTITEKELYDNYPSTFEYSKSYPNGLRDGNNPDYLYLTKTGYTFTGNWLIGSADSTNKISQSFSGTGAQIAEKLGITDFSTDHTVDVYAEWVPEQSPKLDINICVDGVIKYSGFTDIYGEFDFKLNGEYVAYSQGVNWQGKMKDYDKKSPYNTEYILENITAGEGYTYIGASVRDRGSCTPTTTSNKIEENLISDTSITLLFQSECGQQLENIKKLKSVNMNQYISGLFNLYKTYNNFTELLNLSEPYCKKSECNDNKLSLGCLSGSTNPSEFNENNLSCYTGDPLTDISGNYIGFCQTSYNLINNLGVNKFYGDSGRLLIAQNGNTITIFEKNDLDKIIEKNIIKESIATATTSKICYSLSSLNTDSSNDELPQYNVYFGDNDNNNEADLLPNTESEPETPQIITPNGLYKTTISKINNYSLNTIYLEKITGKYSGEKTSSTTIEPIYGILSKFNTEDGIIPFKVNKTSSNYCTFETEPEIITYPPPTPSGELNLEFRIIDTNNPFNRTPKNNWNDGSNKGDINNKWVKDYILNATNSYGIKSGVSNQTPIYKIMLTPDDIKNIRKYNKIIPYDNYDRTCEVDLNNNELCKNTFIENLRNGKVILYDDRGRIDEILSSSKLILKDGYEPKR